MKNTIYVLSRPVRTGKTTELLEWIRRVHNVHGILTPDSGGKRLLAEIASGDLYGFEVDEPSDDTITIGRFHFKADIFEKARDILLSKPKTAVKWTVVDEVGPLEINEGRGLEPAVSELIRLFKDGDRKGNLLLVVRDSMLEKAIDRYNLSNATIVHDTQQLL